MSAKDWTLPFPLPGGFSGRILAGIHASPSWLERRARSQLRGSGGVSPRFPNIPLRAKVVVARLAVCSPDAGFAMSPGLRGLVHLVQLFAGLEANGLAGSDTHLGSGARVAADACLAGLDSEHAKTAQLNALARN